MISCLVLIDWTCTALVAYLHSSCSGKKAFSSRSRALFLHLTTSNPSIYSFSFNILLLFDRLLQGRFLLKMLMAELWVSTTNLLNFSRMLPSLSHLTPHLPPVFNAVHAQPSNCYSAFSAFTLSHAGDINCREQLAR